MLEVFEELVTENSRGPYPVSRIVCRMDWAAEGQSHIDGLVEFESRVNHVWLRHDDAVICTYHLEKFGGDTVIDMMRTHPMVIVGGILQHNPFFMPPEEFVREFRERKGLRGYLLGKPADVESPLESSLDEVKHLQRRINDLVSILALPASHLNKGL